MKKKKLHLTLNNEEFNNKKDELDKFNINYILKKNACSIILETNSYIYECFLIKDKKYFYNVGAIANALKTTKYDDLTNKYGWHLDRQNKVKWDYKIAAGYQECNEYYSKKWLKCWSYDINSAYSFAMLKPMPNTKVTPRYNDIVKENEIGFYKFGGATTKKGQYADIIFPLMDSPFKDYVFKYYELKKTATGIERKKYKDFLNVVTGLIARKNIFLRNAIIYYSNEYIKKYIDENTVYCNIDCIVSLIPRPDIPIGNEIGQFKCEHKNDNFKFLKTCIYQWNTECHYLGIPGETLIDIEKTDNWQDNLYYKYENGKVVLNEKNNNNNSNR